MSAARSLQDSFPSLRLVGQVPHLEPGIYRQLPPEIYHALPYASKSRLWTLRDSPAFCKWEIDHGSPDTDALEFGRAFDDALFSEEYFKRAYEPSGACGAVLKTGANKGKPCGKSGGVRSDGVWYCGQHAPEGIAPDEGITILSDDEYRRIVNMTQSVYDNEIAHALLTGRGEDQLTIVWDDADTGVRCKGRIDRLAQYQGYTTHIDVKTARKAEPRAFEWAAAEYGYFVQAIHYLKGCEAIDVLRGGQPRLRRFMFVVVEKTPEFSSRHRVEVFEYSIEAMADALRTRNLLLRTWALCQKSGVWPHRESRLHTLEIPEAYAHEAGDMED